MKPILFNTQMVQAILAGRKTQTRRPVKPQPPAMIYRDGLGLWYPTGPWAGQDWRCPFGALGEVLYVRETWLEFDAYHRPPRYAYRADITDQEQEEIRQELGYKWRPSIHMPKRASRLHLRVKRVWVERVQDISKADAYAEGVYGVMEQKANSTPERAFWELWNSIYAPKGWSSDVNPLVWACEFEIEQTS